MMNLNWLKKNIVVFYPMYSTCHEISAQFDFVAFLYFIFLKREDVYTYILGVNGYGGIHGSETIVTNMDMIIMPGGL